jgi:hypothetical protein
MTKTYQLKPSPTLPSSPELRYGMRLLREGKLHEAAKVINLIEDEDERDFLIFQIDQEEKDGYYNE